MGWLGTFFYALLYSLIRVMRVLGGWRWRIEGLQNLPPRGSRGIILAMQHVHWVDIPAIGSMVPFSHRLAWLAKVELFKNPLIGWWLRQMYAIPIKRGSRDLDALRAAEEALRDGAVLLIFPEGTRSRSGQLQRGRSGAIRLAMRSDAWLVPVAIIGSERGLRGTIARKPVVVRIGKPYRLEAVTDGEMPWDRMDDFTDELMLRIAALLPEDRRGYYRERLALSEQPALVQPEAHPEGEQR